MSDKPTTDEPAAPAMHISATLSQPARREVGREAADPDSPERNPARWMHQRLVRQIVDFEKTLDSEHEVGGRFVQGPSAEPLHIEHVASWGPDMIIFVGQYSDGRKFELIQHYTQVNLFLVAMRTSKEEPRRIGFELLEAAKEPPDWGDPIS